MLDLGTLQAHIKLDGAKEFQRDLDDSGSKSDKLKDKLKGGLAKVATTVGKALAAVAASAAAALGAVAKQSLDTYADMEQLEGGVNKLFGEDAANTVKKNAQEAFSTMGLSANEYMSNVTSFSASLIQSLGGDTEAAAQAANSAMEDMADNASVFGTDMEQIQSAYQGFAKGQYQLLDNLRLGYGGSKEEMERLLEDAGKLTGQKYDIQNLNDVYSAIHAIQEEQNIAGNAAEEASKTISGSIASTKAAWENLMGAMADPSKDMDAIVDDLAESASHVIENVVPIIENIATAIPKVVPKIAEKVRELAPQILPAVKQLIGSIAAAIPELLSALAPDMSEFFSGMDTSGWSEAWENIKDAASKAWEFVQKHVLGNSDKAMSGIKKGIEILGKVVATITKVAKVLAPLVPIIAGVVGGISAFNAISGIIAAISGAFTFLTTVVIPAIAGIQSFAGAAALLIGAVGGIPIIIAGVVGAIVAFIATNKDAREMVAKVWNAVIKFFSNAFNNIKKTMGNLKAKVLEVVKGAGEGMKSGFSKALDAVVNFFKQLPTKVLSAIGGMATLLTTKGRELVDGMKNGVTNAWETLRSWLNGVGERASSAVGGLASTIWSKGSDLINGMKDGVTNAWDSVSSWLGGISWRAKDAIGDLSGTLWSAGSSIMSGFLDGINAKWDAIKRKVSGMGTWIQEHKGPKSYDLKLLVDNGNWIMQGLMDGIEGSLPALKRQLEGVAGTISSTNFDASAAIGTRGTGYAQASTAQTNYNVYINGTKINNDQQIEGKFMELMNLMARKGMM